MTAMSPAVPFRSVSDPELTERYKSQGYWGDVTVSDLISAHVRSTPDAAAFVTPGYRMTWTQYDSASTRLARTLVASGLEAGERAAVLLDDGASVHAVFAANEKAGLITVGIGARAGELEIRHMLNKTSAAALITHAQHRGTSAARLYERLVDAGVPLRRHIVIPVFEAEPDADVLVNGERVDPAPSSVLEGRRMGPDDLFMINSTSGTTGLPKMVMHTMNSKLYMAGQAKEVAELDHSEVFFGGAPVPFGFGLFTTHFAPLILGAPCVLSDRFSAEQTLELIERERVTVLVCVSTQFKILLNSEDIGIRDLTSLKVMFTGGEMIGYDAARDFERTTGAAVLNFYGSNESGMVTGTRVTDSADRRLRTGGSWLRGTEVKLFDDERRDVTSTGVGQPGSRGPASCLGYFDDPGANRELFTDDGFVLHADIVHIDADGYLTVVGRKSDIIIRGGKNISAAVVEDLVAAHPAVKLAAAVAMPDPLFGERVCVYVELMPGCSLTLPELTEFLSGTGVGKENWPEHLVVMEEIPRSSGSKVAKAELRRDAAERAAAAREPESG